MAINDNKVACFDRNSVVANSHEATIPCTHDSTVIHGNQTSAIRGSDIYSTVKSTDIPIHFIPLLECKVCIAETIFRSYSDL